MKKKFFFFLAMIFCITSLVGCSTDDPIVQEPPQEVSQRSVIADGNESNPEGFTTEQLATLERLNAINAKYAADPNEVQPQAYAINWRRVIRDDAQGAVDGFKYGWAQGSGFTGKIKTAVLTSAVYAVAYSVKSIIVQLFPGLTKASATAEDYSLQDIQKALAVAWNSSELTEQVNEFKRLYPELASDYNEDELRLAVMHNLTLQKLHSGTIIPADVLATLFSSDQQDFFSSLYTRRYYNGVTDIINGQKTVTLFGGSTNFPFTTAVSTAFGNGIMGMSTANLDEFQENVCSLTYDYITEIEGNSSVEEDGKESLVTSFYIAPLSCQYWRGYFGQ